jgi:hypothetical protein
MLFHIVTDMLAIIIEVLKIRAKLKAYFDI